ncbi:type III-B CRISPR module RAMP protein Cmr4 [Clostridium botulinum]|uniref:CRISPR type III-associated protein domain-containing protein n=1 Tax=Clostridium botulinum C/D str. DC5 TaxID=1443128 RepID=A0A0A0IG02_CLOBO|nr:type III-B CRISPR module RAMP protein Cmr4 [Clostridium botulinum]KGM98505.1 hypothetical protein Z955_11440 [Clostridium botulinum C/D str. DC5]KOC51834.1 hypothetical protein ADU89_12715 [Clostridium botulinum]KOC53606.1 hypothetical protein ADU90_13400 [Clostridium botulinum]MCD3234875.1 type III-B CRISPR module RAMP protein Cmr4 [Clostridium botulinum D/C]MCD3240774.1 type III-B CRISPR module RAMP protein Cmr4 [Clostridium botulinum D/C]
MDNFKLYIIENKTNMHVGNGDINFNIIDNEVQRDVITGFPTINPSSLKGSLKAFCENYLTENEMKTIFGDKEKGVGEYKFFGASLLSIPMRSNVSPFFRAICPSIVEEFLNTLEDFEEENKVLRKILQKLERLLLEDNEKNDEKSVGFILSNIHNKNVKVMKVEGYKVEKLNEMESTKEQCKINKKDIEELEKIFGKNLVVINDTVFSNIAKELPIIARNKLENGVSKNLWYEEVIPRKTRFYFGIIECSENKENKKYKEELNRKFNNLIKNDMVQFGANATIGYGYCKIYELGDKNE